MLDLWQSLRITQKKKFIELLIKQGYILEIFKDKKMFLFFEMVGIYFKINLSKLSNKYPHLQNLALADSVTRKIIF